MKILWSNLGYRAILLPALAQSECQILQVTAVAQPKTTPPQADTIEIPFRGHKGKGSVVFDLAFIRSFQALVEAHKPDLVHMSGNRREVIHSMIAMMRYPHIPILLERGAVFGLNILSPLDWICYFGRRQQALLCMSESMRAYFAQHWLLGRWLPHRRLEVLYLALTPPPADTLGREEARAVLGIAADAFVVGTICNIRPTKNLGVVAEAVRLARADVGTIRFAVIGGLQDGKEVRRIARRGDDSLMLLGLRPLARRLIAAFDVFVSPTNGGGEGFGVAVAEAMLAGLPVVTSEVGAAPELIGHGAAGIIAGAQDADAWRRAILLLAGNPSLCARLGLAAKERAGRLFSVDDVAARLLEIYRRRSRPAAAASAPPPIRSTAGAPGG